MLKYDLIFTIQNKFYNCFYFPTFSICNTDQKKAIKKRNKPLSANLISAARSRLIFIFFSVASCSVFGNACSNISKPNPRQKQEDMWSYLP